MLFIRPQQMAVLSESMFAHFEQSAVRHAKRCFPEQCAVLDDKLTLQYVQYGLAHARRYGFESEYDLLRFLNVMFTLGSDFETQSRYAWTLPFLEGRDDPPGPRLDGLIEEINVRLGNRDAAPADETREHLTAESKAFDGLVWEDDIDPNYEPVSIVPDIVPFQPRPVPGSFSLLDNQQESERQKEEERGR